MDANTGRRPAVLSAEDVAQLLEREFPQMYFASSGTTIEQAWHGGDASCGPSPTTSSLTITYGCRHTDGRVRLRGELETIRRRGDD